MGDSLLGELLEGIGFIMGLLFGCFLEKIIVISIARCALSTMNCPQRYDFLHLFLQYSIVLLYFIADCLLSFLLVPGIVFIVSVVVVLYPGLFLLSDRTV